MYVTRCSLSRVCECGCPRALYTCCHAVGPLHCCRTRSPLSPVHAPPPSPLTTLIASPLCPVLRSWMCSTCTNSWTRARRRSGNRCTACARRISEPKRCPPSSGYVRVGGRRTPHALCHAGVQLRSARLTSRPQPVCRRITTGVRALETQVSAGGCRYSAPAWQSVSVHACSVTVVCPGP